MVILSVDLGKARTGTAVCDREEIIASPVEVINEWNRDVLAEKIKAIALERKAEMIVLGLPKNMDGSEGDSAREARAFGDKLHDATGLEIAFSDERGTTITAHQYLNVNNVRGMKRKNTVDKVAAVIILEDYMNYRKNRKNRGEIHG
jgi:putative Holliday junction resolvase